MNVEAIPTGAFQENCCLVWNADNEVVVFDPGADAERLDRAIGKRGLRVAAYVCTHGHADHIGALAALHAFRPAPVAMHSADRTWAFGASNQIAPYYDVPALPDTDILPLETEEAWSFGDLRFTCIHTPGHSPGSCCLLFPEDGVLIAGDTLFQGSCGRTDLPGGDPRQLRKSLDKLKQLPGAVRVFPGHGPDTTIGAECATNFFMQ